jgi:thiamine-phosphate pyrophosphorylase
MCSENRRKIADNLKLYLILETDYIKFPLKDFINMVIDGGITAIQLRNKGKTAKENYEIGIELSEYLHNKNILFVVNDRIDLAKTINCNAVHLGIKDLPIKIAKNKFPEFIIGYSCNNISDLQKAKNYKADYIGIGPAFFTRTKKDLRTLLGIDGIKNLALNTDIPAVAIGGINQDNANQLSDAGVKGIAVSSVICSSKNPYETTYQLRKIVDNFKNND